MAMEIFWLPSVVIHVVTYKTLCLHHWSTTILFCIIRLRVSEIKIMMLKVLKSDSMVQLLQGTTPIGQKEITMLVLQNNITGNIYYIHL